MFQGPLISGCAALEFLALLGFQKVESQRRKCLGDPRKGCGVPGEFYQVSGRQGWVQADFPGDAHSSRCYVRFIILAHPVLSTSNSSQAFDRSQGLGCSLFHFLLSCTLKCSSTLKEASCGQEPLCLHLCCSLGGCHSAGTWCLWMN